MEVAKEKVMRTAYGATSPRVGVFRVGSCGNYKYLSIKIDCENGNSKTSVSGNVGDTYVDGGDNMRLEFCMVDAGFRYPGGVFLFEDVPLETMTLVRYHDTEDGGHNGVSRVLAGLIKQKLLEDAAKKENMSLEEFIDWFVQQKICVGQDSLKKRYGFNTQSFYVKGELIPLVKGSLEEKLSYQQKLRSRIVQALVDSLYQKADIKRFLYPPKQPECVVRDLCVYYRGNLDSPVSFIVASDYNCERCVQFEKTLSKLYDNYKERVKFGFVHFADAPSLAALACEAAGEQKQFWTFHDTIFNYSGVADSAFIYNLAKSKRLNMTEFDAYLHSSDKYKEMDKVINQLVERGLMATPTIIINDRLVYVTNSYEELSRLLEYEL